MRFGESIVPGDLGEGWEFDLIHISGIVCLTTSVICAFVVVALTVLKEPKANNIKKFFKLPIGERLVFYLAILGIGYGISHLIDHCYTLYARQLPPDGPCSAIGFSVLLFVAAYLLMNAFIAFNAFIMTVKQRKIGTGKYDWKLLSVCFGTGLLSAGVLLGVQHVGPGGAWCLIDERKTYGAMISNMLGVTLILTFTVMVVCYCAVWIYIKKASSSTSNIGGNRYGRTIRTMMLTVSLFTVQMWSYVVYSCWVFVATPPIALVFFIVTFPNLGGLYSLMIYVRLKYFKWKTVQNLAEGPPQANHAPVPPPPPAKPEQPTCAWPSAGNGPQETEARPPAPTPEPVNAGDLELDIIASEAPKEVSANYESIQC